MTQELPSIIKVSELFQVGVVVHDLEKSMKTYENLLGIDKWEVVEIDSSTIPMTYRGESADLSFKAAFCMLVTCPPKTGPSPMLDLD